MKWVYELPETVRTELMKDAREILEAVHGENHEAVEEGLDNVAREKLINVVGDEWGMLPVEKYGKYIFER